MSGGQANQGCKALVSQKKCGWLEAEEEKPLWAAEAQKSIGNQGLQSSHPAASHSKLHVCSSLKLREFAGISST
eukprot:1153210-Pelagomonas_calceolata.AAC.2